MAEVDSEWAEVWRTQAHDAALAACFDLARASTNPHDAAFYYARATEIDLLCEDAWRGLIGVWEKEGDTVRTAHSRTTYQ